jgi:hypothetical protein
VVPWGRHHVHLVRRQLDLRINAFVGISVSKRKWRSSALC